MRYVAVVAFVLLWLLWSVPFGIQRYRNRGQPAVVKAPTARWGILTQALAFAVAWLHRPQSDAAWLIVPAWRVIVVIAFGVAGLVLGTTAVVTLGKQWRYDAALIADHQLVQSGPYAIVRHPIYTSMIAMLFATGFAVSGWLQFAIAVVLIILGTEIRVRAEERLLADRFGPRFDAYRAHVPAYLPLLR